jgi:O-antigen ligase
VPLSHHRPAVWAIALAAGLIGAVLWIVATYPLPRGPLALCLLLYAVLLWRRPFAWLVLLPCLIPVADLAPLTGWMYIQESDLFAAVTLAVLLLRSPPERGDVAIGAIAGVAVVLSAVAYAIATVRGLLPVTGVPDVSDNAYLDADNALRLLKGFAIPLALLPFLGRTFRVRDDAFRLLARGMLLGLLIASTVAVVERAVFSDVLDLADAYRVVATFSSMHVGGGHIGAFMAMALPFLAVGLSQRRHPWWSLTAVVTAVIAGFALVATFSRTGIVAGMLAIGVVTVGYAAARLPTASRSVVARLVALGLGAVALSALVAVAAESSFLRARLAHIAPDFEARRQNWTAGLAVHRQDAATLLVGTGLGTYPRIFAARTRYGSAPATFAVRSDDGGAFLRLDPGQTIYFGQKVRAVADRPYRLSVDVRFADERSAFAAFLCEKWLLYSIRCRHVTIAPRQVGVWQTFATEFDPLAWSGLDGPLPRPVEFSFSSPKGLHPVDLRGVRLLDARGNNLVANGDFAGGTTRWLFTDDHHLSWRIKSQYLMLFFEQGVLGILAFAAVVAATLLSAGRAYAAGVTEASVVIASVIGFVAAGFADYLTEVPRLTTLFYLTCFAGLCQHAVSAAARHAGNAA